MTEQETKLEKGQIVFFVKVEEFWDKPYVMKRHHVPEVRSVILRGRVTDIKGKEFKAILTGNNGFEKDGQEFVFNVNSLLCDQNYTDLKSLGKWKTDKSLND